ncbi:unnamed protein product [Lampetra planeri]
MREMGDMTSSLNEVGGGVERNSKPQGQQKRSGDLLLLSGRWEQRAAAAMGQSRQNGRGGGAEAASGPVRGPEALHGVVSFRLVPGACGVAAGVAVEGTGGSPPVPSQPTPAPLTSLTGGTVSVEASADNLRVVQQQLLPTTNAGSPLRRHRSERRERKSLARSTGVVRREELAAHGGEGGPLAWPTDSLGLPATAPQGWPGLAAASNETVKPPSGVGDCQMASEHRTEGRGRRVPPQAPALLDVNPRAMAARSQLRPPFVSLANGGGGTTSSATAQSAPGSRKQE